MSTDESLTYGEIVHASFIQLLDNIKRACDIPPNSVFVDLGMHYSSICMRPGDNGDVMIY